MLPLVSAYTLGTSLEAPRRCWTPRDLEGSAGPGTRSAGETFFSLLASFILLVFLFSLLEYSINVYKSFILNKAVALHQAPAPVLMTPEGQGPAWGREPPLPGAHVPTSLGTEEKRSPRNCWSNKDS